MNPQQKPNRKPSRNSNRRRQNQYGLDYLDLEQRLPLTGFVVNTIIDDASGATDGFISLREAVIASNTNAAFGDAPAGQADGDTIKFDASITGSTITLTEGQFNVTDDLLIQGGASNITIDGDSNSRIFQVATSERVAFGKLTFTGGQAALGGAISSLGGGTTLVNASTFDGNVATGLGGGAIYHEVGNLYIYDSVFTNNEANGAAGSGGALYSATGTTVINGGAMLSNSANRAGGAIEIVNSDLYTTNLQVGDSGQGNVAGPVGFANPGSGGGLHITGAPNVVITGGEYSSNYAAREGGGIWNQAGADLFIRSGANIFGNVAAGNNAEEGGGGIFNNGGSMYIAGATISTNTASGDAGSGGGIFTKSGEVILRNTTVESNTANRAGGGLEVINGRVVLRSSTLGGAMSAQGNVAGPMGSAMPGNGGGLHVSGGAASVYVVDTSVANNVAASEGGGLWNQAGSLMRIDSNSVVELNQANGDAADNGGGGVFNNGGRLTVVGSQIIDNDAGGASGSGGGIFSTDGTVLLLNSTIDGNAAARAGGGIEVINGYTLLSGTALTNNDAGILFTAAPGNGGGLHVSGGSSRVVLDDSDVTGNNAANQGGGLWNQTGSDLILRNQTNVSNNMASGIGAVGGGVYNKGYLGAMDSFFESNFADDEGGGLYVTDSGTSVITNSEFNTNTATNRGGGIYNDGYVRAEDSSFTGNVVTIDGGAIFTDALATTVSTNNTFAGNLPNATN